MISLILLFILFAFAANEFLNLNDSLRLRQFIYSLYAMTADSDEEWSGVLWPSTGNPAVIYWQENEGTEIQVYFSSKFNLMLPTTVIAASILPINMNSVKESIELIVQSVEKVDLSKKAIGWKWSNWIIKNNPNVYKIIFKVPASEIVRRYKRVLCDLRINVNDLIFEKTNAVFMTSRETNALNILVASDIHVSTRWDEIETNVRNTFPLSTPGHSVLSEVPLEFDFRYLMTQNTFSDSFVNPNRNLVKLIKEANALFDQGKVDFMIILGDIVDYKYKNLRGNSIERYSDTEWSLFENMISGKYPASERLRVPFFTTTGNHDYRLYPYNLQVYGLRHCAIADAFTNEYLKKNKEFRTIKYHLSDLDAVRINTGNNHSLNYYYNVFSPFDDFSLELGGVQHIFLDTGSDTYCHPKNIFSKRWKLFLSGLINAVEHPNSQGIDDQQVNFASEVLASCDRKSPAILYLHAPFLNDGRENGKEKSAIKLDMTNRPTDASILALEKDLAKTRLNLSTTFRNQLPVLYELAARSGQSVVISGHGHHNAEFAVQKKTGDLEQRNQSSYNQLKDKLETHLLLLNGAALGHVERSTNEGAIPSYRIIIIKNKEVLAVEQHPIITDIWKYPSIAVQNDASGNSEIMDIDFHNELTGQIYYKLVFLLMNSKGSWLWEWPMNLEITNGSGDNAINSFESRGTGNPYASFLVTGQFHKFVLKNRPKNVKIAFTTEAYEKSMTGYRLLGIVRSYNEF